MIKSEWILCPFCGHKTHNKIRSDTVLKNFPLFCPKCKRETLVNASHLIVTTAESGANINCSDKHIGQEQNSI